MAYSTDDIITWAEISQPLAAIGEKKKSATRGRSTDPVHDQQLYLVRKTVEWYNSQATIDTDILYTIANYLYALTFPYGLKAQFINGNGGGQVVPITPGTGNLIEPYDFIVATTTSSFAPMKEGDTVVYLDGTNGTRNFKGMNVEFYRGGQPQYTTSPGDGSTYYSWNPVTGRFSIYPAAQLAEPFRIIPTVAATAQTGSPDITIVEYNLTTTTVIPNPTVPTSIVRIYITPNGFTYTWDTNFRFSDNWPEQSGMTADNTVQMYEFTYRNGLWECTDQSLNLSE